LLEWPPDQATRVKVRPTADGKLAFETASHRQAPRQVVVPPRFDHQQWLGLVDEIHHTLEDAARALDRWDCVDDEDLGEAKLWYYTLRDAAGAFRTRLGQAEDALEAAERARRRKLAARTLQAFREPGDETLRIMPPELLENVVDQVLAGGLSARALAACFEPAVALPRPAAAVLRLAWRARWLQSLCAQPGAPLERWCLRADDGAPPLAGPPPRWSRFCECRSGEDPGTVVLEGRALAPLVRALCCVTAVVADGNLRLRAVTAVDGPAVAPAIARLACGDSLLDLRSGLLANPALPEPLDLALALCFAEPV
jgi:hypothetical protein